jgi:hypothetical protein
MNGHKALRPQFVSALLSKPVGIFGLVLAVFSLFTALCPIGYDCPALTQPAVPRSKP